MYVFVPLTCNDKSSDLYVTPLFSHYHVCVCECVCECVCVSFSWPPLSPYPSLLFHIFLSLPHTSLSPLAPASHPGLWHLGAGRQDQPWRNRAELKLHWNGQGWGPISLSITIYTKTLPLAAVQWGGHYSNYEIIPGLTTAAVVIPFEWLYYYQIL